MPPTWLFVWRLERPPPPLLWQPQTLRVASKDCVVGEKKGDLHARFDSRVQQNGPLHGPMFAQKHPYMRRRSTPPSAPPKLLHRSHECHEYPPFFWRNLWRKKQNEDLEHPFKAGQGTEFLTQK